MQEKIQAVFDFTQKILNATELSSEGVVSNVNHAKAYSAILKNLQELYFMVDQKPEALTGDIAAPVVEPVPVKAPANLNVKPAKEALNK